MALLVAVRVSGGVVLAGVFLPQLQAVTAGPPPAMAGQFLYVLWFDIIRGKHSSQCAYSFSVQAVRSKHSIVCVLPLGAGGLWHHSIACPGCWWHRGTTACHAQGAGGMVHTNLLLVVGCWRDGSVLLGHTHTPHLCYCENNDGGVGRGLHPPSTSHNVALLSLPPAVCLPAHTSSYILYIHQFRLHSSCSFFSQFTFFFFFHSCDLVAGGWRPLAGSFRGATRSPGR